MDTLISGVILKDRYATTGVPFTFFSVSHNSKNVYMSVCVNDGDREGVREKGEA